nr:hypothetical protein [Tanacetum cinerariifolium]
MVVVNHVMDIIVNHVRVHNGMTLFNEICDNCIYGAGMPIICTTCGGIDSDIHQLIEECSIKVPEQQKQKIEDTMFELVKICQEKELLFIHDDVNDLIESAFDSKLLLINSNSQHLDKKEQEIKNVVEQPTEHGNHSIQSLQNFRVVHKSSISFKDTSQISSIHSIAPIQSTKEPEHLLSMGYEHLRITPETESDEGKESNAENLLPIPSKCEVTLEDEI